MTELPLAGLRVMDLTVVWSGPTVTMLLSDLGAEVIRIDNPWVFPSSTKGLMARPTPGQMSAVGITGSAYPDFDPGEAPWDRHAMFVWHARGKRQATLDLRKESGRRVFLKLVAKSDVFVENNNVSLLSALGIDWDVLHSANPRLVVLRMPPFGDSGPYSRYLGFGSHFEAIAGITAVRGYADSDPTTTSPVNHMDPAAGATGAFAVMAALRRRARTGKGELIVVPQVENEMNQIGEMFIDAALNGNPNTPLGNRDRNYAPQGVYPCLGEDQWVAISVGTDDEWTALVAAMGSPEWARDAALATSAGRRAAQDTIDERLSEWTSQLTNYEVFHACQSRGAPAGPVMSEAAAFYDPHARARGFFRSLEAARAGTHDHPGHQWKWTGPDMRWLPVGSMGRDNEYVYREVLGLDDKEWEELEREGHIATRYFNADGSAI